MDRNAAQRATSYFEERGYELRVESRDLHADYMAQGEPGRASFYEAGARYYCVGLMRDGHVVHKHYADGRTVDAALMRAMQRYGSEQT